MLIKNTVGKVWGKQNKELQQKIYVKVERNHKLHEYLVDAYSKVRLKFGSIKC